MTTAAEHFRWAQERALEYVAFGNGPAAMASFVSDLNKGPGTAGLLHNDLLQLFAGEVHLAGARGARRFIEGLAGPADQPRRDTT